jgi:Rod binding domain-containing protein
MTEKLLSLTAGTTPPVPSANGAAAGKTGAAAKLSPADEKALRLQKACEDMESLFVHQLIKEMRATIPKSGLFGKSQAQDIYTGMLDGRLAQEIAQSRGLGLSNLLMRQLGAIESPGDDDGR